MARLLLVYSWHSLLLRPFDLCGGCLAAPGEVSSVLFSYNPWTSPGIWDAVQSLSRVQSFATPWTAARQASLSFTISQSLLKLMSIESVMPSNHLILYCPLLLLPSIFPSIRVFSSELGVLKTDGPSRPFGEHPNS